MAKIGFLSLGCPKNLVDSERILTELRTEGYDVVPTYDNADMVIVNTCGFIDSAVQESLEAIGEALKENGKVIVTGCLGAKEDQIREVHPKVLEITGPHSYEQVLEHVHHYTPKPKHNPFLSLVPEQGVKLTPRHYAYLKIGEGCDWKCGYCAIPLIRGPHVSVPMEQVLDEARRLAAGGVRELMVIAQDTTYYGVDLYGRRRLADLLTELCRIGGIEWIRLHYAYPTGFPDDVIEVMAHEPKICKYLDIPFQHISDAQLKAMKRRHTKADAYRLVERLRAAVPDIALRTTLLVGYPGETEADFAELLQFVDDVRFDRLGVFAYSEEEGTYSALHLKDDVPDEVKRRRVERIMERQKAISLDNNLRRVGRTERVVVDARQGDYYVCRTQYDSPEVDQELLIPAGGRRLRRGCFYEARITAAEEYDLYGELTERRKR